MPAADPYPYVYVNADGTARELHPSEQKYLETEFKGGDGAAPYAKSSYAERDGWGELTGYLERSLLPDGIPIHDAPADDPKHAFSREKYIAWLRSKGAEVTENSDGSLTISKPRRPQAVRNPDERSDIRGPDWRCTRMSLRSCGLPASA
jgi:hypothetical protein